MVTDIFSGEYRSVFKGKGMEFAEVREYQPGDDVRTIDWNVTARMDRPFVKQFTEERELTVFFIVDVSSSMGFGTRERTKKELVAELCAVLAFTAIKNKDKVGVILFSDHIEKYIPPSKGKRHVLRVIRELLAAGSEKREGQYRTDIKEALDYFNKVQRKRSVCFVVSDFLCAGFEDTLNITTKKHDLVAVKIEDELEKEFKAGGLYAFEDLENGRNTVVDFSSKTVRQEFMKAVKNYNDELLKKFKTKGIDYFVLETGKDYLKILNKFFKEREKRMKK